MRQKIASRIYEIFWNELKDKMGLELFYQTFHDYDDNDTWDKEFTASKCLSFGFHKLSIESQQEISKLLRFF